MGQGIPLISIIIPTYNHHDVVLATLDSVFAQTLTDFEVIVINDGSPDDTAAVLRPLIDAGRIRYFEQSNAGQSTARNRGIELARGQFIALLDDDDLWPTDKLQWQSQALLAQPAAGMIYGSSSQFGEQTDLPAPAAGAPSGWVYEKFLRYNYIRSPGQTLIRADLLRKLGGFDTSIWGADDWDLYLRLAKEATVIFEPRLALLYRVHTGNASRNIARMFQNTTKVRRKHLGFWPRPGQMRLWWACRQYVINRCCYDYIHTAEARMTEGKWKEARRLFLSAARVKPIFLRHPRLAAKAMKSLMMSFGK
jgi:glycosyltransferase involved in cell wall biosynthesis